VSPDLPRISGAATCSALERAGFTFRSQRGSHRKLRHSDGRTVIVPMHRELAPGTLRSILKQAGLTIEEFRALLT
jgi:predicted RNA binding protein YcfA (HicA-like mRNA interferase family)